jgi:ribulose-5-phosphate 4-epimerase/fuculose-1-phosphate aldolase
MTLVSRRKAIAMTEAEWQTRVELAACYRLVHRYKMTDMIYNHITARVPGEGHRLLINPYGLLYSEITASSLIKIDLDGTIVTKSDLPYDINPAGYIIHSAIHGAREDVVCVLHTHTRAGTAVSCMEEGLLPISQTALAFDGRLSYHVYEGPVMDDGERERLVASLGRNNYLVLRNHGLLTCGANIGAAFVSMLMLERACQIQIDAMASGKLVLCSDYARDYTRNLFERSDYLSGLQLEWQALLREVEKSDPDYKD